MESQLIEWSKKISEHLERLILEHPQMPHQHLFAAARYSLLSGGKRLRPLLTIVTSHLYGTPIEKAIYPACALELIHTYSLIHDDLPCMDDDDLRRGRPTLHKVYTEGHAVLTGDYLLTYAFQVLCESPYLTPQQKVDLIHLLSSRAGADGMIGGQVVDMSMEGKMIDWETLQFMHEKKTAALISAALEFGAIIADAPQEDRLHLRAFGDKLGVAFQVVDDILDMTGKEELLGKPIGSDKDNHKATALSLLTVKRAKEVAGEIYEAAIKELDKLPVDTSLLKDLSAKLIHRQA